MRKAIDVPELDHDAYMLTRFGHKVSVNGRLERRIVAALCEHLAARGFQVVGVYDGESLAVAASAKEAMEVVFNLDESNIYFAKPDSPRHYVFLVCGNGEDIISDWNYTTGDPDGFNAAMDAFNVEDWL